MKRLRSTSGFTLVELLIVIIIIAILAAITIIAYNGITQKAHVAALQSTIAQTATKLAAYNAENDGYPAQLTDAVTPSSDIAYQYVTNAAQDAYCLQMSPASASSSTLPLIVMSDNSTPQSNYCGSADGASNCPTGFIPVPVNMTLNPADPNGFCVMKYEAKRSGNTPVSQATGSFFASSNQPITTSAIAPATLTCAGCHLITDPEWMAIAASVISVPSNWTGGAVGSGSLYVGNSQGTSALVASTDDTDGYYGETSPATNQRRTLTLANGEVIWDFSGNYWEWDTGTLPGGAQPGLSGDTTRGVRQWNDSSLIWNGLPATSRPGAISAQAAGWSTTQGIGELWSNYNGSSPVSFIRGGSVGTGATGLLALYLIEPAGNGSQGAAVRVTR